MTTRSYEAVIEIVCCKDGLPIYQPAPRTIIGGDTKTHFKELFYRWKKRIEMALDKKYREIAGKECYLVGSRRLCLFDMKVTFSEELENVVSGTVYRILRMGARGKVHIYGLSSKEFHDRMSHVKEKYNNKHADELLMLFKQGLVTTEAKI